MSSRPGSFGTILSLFALSTTLSFSQISAQEIFVFHHENVMGTSLELRVKAQDRKAADWAETQVLTEIERLSDIMSGYDPNSEFSRWMANASAGPVTISEELFTLLKAADEWNAKSNGAFDPRVEGLTRLWTSKAKAGRIPMRDEIDQVTEAIRLPAWKLDLAAKTAERLGSAPLTLNAIAKGDIVERATRLALDRSHGVLGLCLNVGGDMRVAGEMTEVIGIAAPNSDSETSEPLVHIEVKDRAIGTSGRSQRGLMIQGKWYSHIFNPATGEPAPQIALASVVAKNGRDADALATICNVLAPEQSLKLIESLIDVDALIVTIDGKIFKSANWGKLEKAIGTPLAFHPAQAPQTAAGTAKSAHWGDTNEVVIDFEVAMPSAENKGGRKGYRRPYVAVWIEDAKGFPVRTLSLWIGLGGSGPDRWLDDLRRWYRADEIRTLVDKKNMVYRTARPTRSPGQYSMIWDGKDDAGKPLPAGKYVVYLESAREHGPYSITHKDITISDQPFDEEIKANVELKSARVAYREKAPAK